MDNFQFTIRVTCCAECPCCEEPSFGIDCSLNNSDRPFYMPNQGRDGVSRDCPYRKMDANGCLHHYFNPIKE